MVYENKYIEHEEYVEIVITSKTHGVFNAKIDFDDLKMVKQYHWGVQSCWNKNTNTEKIFYIQNSKTGLLHRYIMSCEKGMVVDHINIDTTDCRKSNLRVCRQCENRRNNKLYSSNKSGHAGVRYDNKLKTPKWTAKIKVNYKTINLGYFDIMEDAIKARLDAEEYYFGEFAPNRDLIVGAC